MNYKNWQLHLEENIAWLSFNCENSDVNTLNTQAMQELSDMIDAINAMPQAPKGLIILSSKASGFCMGADIHEFLGITDLDRLKQHLILGQQTLQKIAQLPYPTVALIHGFCLGGGLELALACRYRIACDDARTQLTLPEVLLGLLPAWNGTKRLPQTINPITALQIMLTGRMQNARNAKRIGLVDVIVPERQLKNAARYTVLNPMKKHRTLMQYLFSLPGLRKLVGFVMRKQVAKQVNPSHYPAPFKIIHNWQHFGAHEADDFMDLLAGDTAKNLIRIFLLREQLKSLGKKSKSPVQHVHVIGAGTMGGDIATWCMLKGLKVSLQDKDAKSLESAMKRAYAAAVAKLKNPRDVTTAMDRLTPDVNGDGLAHADVVIEAIFENLAIKQALLQDIAKKVKEDAIIATNTSSISLDDLKSALPHPEKLMGIHFFNPVGKMELVEVVHTKNADKTISERTIAFVHQIAKLPLKVKNCPGFLVNRAAAPYMLEAVHLLAEGKSIEDIDNAATSFGMLMGPLAMADLVGLDVCLAAAKNLTGESPKLLQDKIAQGHLGKKSGQGFYTYPHKATKVQTTFDPVILDRLLLPLINECVACYGEKIVTSLDDIDAGLIFGIGFAPYQGGPMQYAKQQGYKNIYEQLKAYESTVGARYKPSQGWDALLKL